MESWNPSRVRFGKAKFSNFPVKWGTIHWKVRNFSRAKLNWKRLELFSATQLNYVDWTLTDMKVIRNCFNWWSTRKKCIVCLHLTGRSNQSLTQLISNKGCIRIWCLRKFFLIRKKRRKKQLNYDFDENYFIKNLKRNICHRRRWRCFHQSKFLFSSWYTSNYILRCSWNYWNHHFNLKKFNLLNSLFCITYWGYPEVLICYSVVKV